MSSTDFNKCLSEDLSEIFGELPPIYDELDEKTNGIGVPFHTIDSNNADDIEEKDREVVNIEDFGDNDCGDCMQKNATIAVPTVPEVGLEVMVSTDSSESNASNEHSFTAIEIEAKPQRGAPKKYKTHEELEMATKIRNRKSSKKYRTRKRDEKEWNENIELELEVENKRLKQEVQELEHSVNKHKVLYRTVFQTEAPVLNGNE